jgi:hypothetical protein
LTCLLVSAKKSSRWSSGFNTDIVSDFNTEITLWLDFVGAKKFH